MKMLRSFFLASLFFVVFLPRVLCAEAQPDGLWNATVTVGPADIPFRFEVAHNGDQWTGFFFEGDKKIASTSGTFDQGTLNLNYEFLNAVLVVKFDGTSLSGTYRYNRKTPKEYPFHASRGPTQNAASLQPASVAGDWEMQPVLPENPAAAVGASEKLSWNLYLRQSGPAISGSILRVDGDTGTLTGGWQGNVLVLSHFAGERAILFEGTLQPDGSLKVLVNKNKQYLAVRTSEASAKGITSPVDPSRYTNVKDAGEPFQFRFPDINGTIYSNGDERFKGKVVVLAIGGTWCPNCRDEAPFLVDLYRRYHSRGLEIVGLNFEDTGNPVEDKPRIVSFVREFSVPYPVLYAGQIAEVKDKLPQIADFGAYPTTIYLGRDGRVARIHAGFASAATGEAHAALQREANELIEELLQQKQARQER
jgi:thiol-disulfide isomerase/thioredoxin